MTKRPTRPALGDALGKRIAPKGDAPATAPAGDLVSGPFIPRASKQKGRGVLIRVNEAGWQALRIMAYEQGRTLNDVGVEAFQDVLRKHGKPVVLDKPED